jgi:hypothetical protein
MRTTTDYDIQQAFGMARLRKELETLRDLAIALQLLCSEFAA